MRRALEHLCTKSAIPVDFGRAYWTPPLSPRHALEVETKQFEDDLGVAALVSITDHDSIKAPAALQMSPDTDGVPLSMEWSVPFRGNVFHLGIQNLPPERAQAIADELNACTTAACEEHASDLLSMLHGMPDVLIVFNHPLWDMAGWGTDRHAAAIDQFIERNQGMLHALELNGMRKWTENRYVMPLAERWKLPLISGGDRHACEPSASVNLTNAQSFAEFVHEVRREKLSHVLFMAQYAEPMCVRVTHSVLDVIREYPNYPEGWRRWDDRVFHPDRNGVPVPLSSMWTKPPEYINRVMAFVRLAENTTIQKGLRRIYPGDAELHPSEVVS